ncbi:hypothetical protein FHS43_001510 [Streptosporangium becharense]|uniref:Tetratricopeptide repeat protein n=1 Tax=Streptosporangium becharense TaxID=1816182 RepID=A0A7W9ILL1_9ACTN|nr:tetratricopeptide repeat protein [Streptosporangium becharense]MBB2910247.1 hypothetical protein [Streptosporangium becharense]MBB5822990.1 hypothetical protein [Streptosporangium becharense]
MSQVLMTGGVVVAFLGLLVLAALQDLVSEEIRARLERLPFAILRLAARRLPEELHAEVYEKQWLPDLEFQLSGETGAGPITRLVAANRWALSMLLRRGGVRTAQELYACDPVGMRGFEDIRQLSRRRRRQFDALTARLGELCRLPADDFDDDTLARLASAVAIACEALVNDRAERLAVTLAAPLAGGRHPVAGRLASDHPAMLGVRRSHAHARLQLGHPQAEGLLRELHRDETALFGRDDPRTFPTLQLLCWAAAQAGRHEEAEAGLRALEARIARLPDPDLSLLRHIQCKRHWVQSELGRRHRAAEGYREVIADRSSELGFSHGDTLDTRHSLGKMLVLDGDGAQALEILRPVLTERRRLQGRRHPDTLETAKYLALARLTAHPEPGPVARHRLRRRLHRILRTQIHAQGADHPAACDTRRWLTRLTAPAKRS